MVLLSWSAWVSKTHPVENKGVATKIAKESIPAQPQPTAIVPVLPAEIPSSSLFTLSSEKYELVFIEPQAAIKEIVFKEYPSAQLSLQQGFWIGDATFIFQRESTSSENEVKFVYKDKEKRIIKRFIFSNSGYAMELKVEIQNLSSGQLNFNLPLTLGVLNFAGNQYEARYQDATFMAQDKALHLNARKDKRIENVRFAGLRNRYFCAIVEPTSHFYSAEIKKLSSHDSMIGVQSQELILAPGQYIEETFRVYLGPQDLKVISGINSDWSAIAHYGTFNIISHLLLQVLDVLYRLVHNWGVAIVILSLCIYFLLYPLTLKQMRSMKEIQVLQPQVEELRRLHKSNPQRLNKEIMELYRQHKVNPLGGCLPLILQLPIFFALYQALMRAVALKGANFLWIKDLSEPDRLFSLPFALPILGNEVNILPIVMAIGMFVQQRFSLSSAGGTSAEQQRLMSILFPFMFGIIFYRMPSALVLYWFINSMLTLGYQFWMRRKT